MTEHEAKVLNDMLDAQRQAFEISLEAATTEERAYLVAMSEALTADINAGIATYRADQAAKRFQAAKNADA